MKVKEFLQTTPVFTTADVQKVSSSKESAETLLRRAVASGEIQRIRRGLYASKTGKYHGEAAEPFRVISTLDPNAIVSYHTALVAHGLAHNVSFEYSFRSSSVKSPFSFEDVRYVPYAANELLEQKQREWRVEEDYLANLESRLGKGPYRFGSAQRRAEGWSNRWKLCLPESEEEVASWVWG